MFKAKTDTKLTIYLPYGHNMLPVHLLTLSFQIFLYLKKVFPTFFYLFIDVIFYMGMVILKILYLYTFSYFMLFISIILTVFPKKHAARQPSRTEGGINRWLHK